MNRNTPKDWFTIEVIDDRTHCISEYRHWEETHCYLLEGETRSLLIDTGLGIENIAEQVIRLTDKPVTVAATHVHWDHIGGHGYFPDFYAHQAEIDWLGGGFPLSRQEIISFLTKDCDLPESFAAEKYQLFQGMPTRILQDGDVIDLGNRRLEVLHTPGHSPGHLCFYERETGYLFTGDLIYRGTLFAYYPSTDPAAYLASAERVAALPVARVFPAHHDLNVPPALLIAVKDALTSLKKEGKLHHGSGIYDFEEFAVRL